MDGVSAAASILAIATAGVQISIKLVALSSQVTSAAERINVVNTDVSLSCNILHELGELLSREEQGDAPSLMRKGRLETILTSALTCKRVFDEITKAVGSASEALHRCGKSQNGQVRLSKMEHLKWPFHQPSIDVLRGDLREAKGTLTLMLMIWNLAISKSIVAQYVFIP